MMVATETKCILLVEDDQDDAALAVRALTANRIGNEIVHVRDGAEARDYLFGVGAYAGRDVTDCPQLVLLDLKLPKIDGLDILRRMRADDRTRLIPVVVLTSSDAEEDLLRSYALGANSFVRKPVNFDQFVDAVRELSIYWLLINEPPPKPS